MGAFKAVPPPHTPLTALCRRLKTNAPGVDGVAELRSVPGSYCPAIASISAVIARSQILVAQPCRAVPTLPAGFNYTDIAVLDWIAAEGRRQAAARPSRPAGSA